MRLGFLLKRITMKRRSAINHPVNCLRRLLAGFLPGVCVVMLRAVNINRLVLDPNDASTVKTNLAPVIFPAVSHMYGLTLARRGH